MGRIPEEVVDEVLERTDMLQIVGEYVQLKRAGTSYKGLCPFHSEKSPSFNVHPDRGFFKCFGCGEGGSTYAFLMKMEGWTFPEAVRYLAARVGIEVAADEDDAETRRRRDEKDEYIRITRLAQAFFERQLWEGPDDAPRRYLLDRGVDEETSRAFGLGWAPDTWSDLLDYLVTMGQKPAEIEAAGLIKPGNRGFYDRFRARVMFPVFDIMGNPLAFSGRVIVNDPDKPGAKYINSPETPFYTKGRELFGLYTTKAGIRAHSTAMLVEGNFDVVTLYARGVTNAVAPLGTALTERQVRLLSRFCKRVHVAFDGDKAGQAATFKSLPGILQHDFDARVVELPEGDDPDSYVRTAGRSKLQERLDHARPLVAWAIDRVLDGKLGAPIEERVAALEGVSEILGNVHNNITWQHYAADVARRLDIPPKQIAAYLKRPSALRQQTGSDEPRSSYGAGASTAAPTPAPRVERASTGIASSNQGFDSDRGSQTPANPVDDGFEVPQLSVEPRAVPALEAACLQVLSDSPDKLREFVDNGCCPLLTDERLVFLIERVCEQHKLADKPPEYVMAAQRLAAELGDPDYFDQVSAILCSERGYTEENLDKNYFDLITRLQLRWLEREQVRANQMASRVIPDTEEENELILLLAELNHVRRDLDLRLQKKKVKGDAGRSSRKSRVNLDELVDDDVASSDSNVA